MMGGSSWGWSKTLVIHEILKFEKYQLRNEPLSKTNFCLSAWACTFRRYEAKFLFWEDQTCKSVVNLTGLSWKDRFFDFWVKKKVGEVKSDAAEIFRMESAYG